MPSFEPCHGKQACRDDGERCLTCGRTLAEIARLREAIDALAGLALDYGYDNVADYAAYVARKLEKTVSYRREQAG